MLTERYRVEARLNFTTYQFDNAGPQGTIRKIVVYEYLRDGIFNLAFGDKDKLTGKMNDLVKTNNSDREKVLATVAATLLTFTKHYPGSLVYVEGSTTSRTRLYQIGIGSNLEEITRDFLVAGLTEHGWEYFRRGTNIWHLQLEGRFRFVLMKTNSPEVDKALPEGFRFNPDIPDYSNDPVVIKKKKRAEEMIKKYGLPKDFVKK